MQRWRRDGSIDLVTANYDSASASVLLNQGDGTFVVGGEYGAGQGAMSITAADLNGDGRPDIAGAKVSVLLNACLP